VGAATLELQKDSQQEGAQIGHGHREEDEGELWGGNKKTT